MIVYEATKGEFVDSVFSGSITDEIYDVYKQKIGKSNKSQIRSWENSMEFMYKILIDEEIPDDSGCPGNAGSPRQMHFRDYPW